MSVTESSTSPQASRKADPSTGSSRISDWIPRYGLLGLFALMFLFFTFFSKTSSTFPTRLNLITIVSNQAVTAIVALALVVSATAGIIDLCVGATTGIASIAAAATMSRFHQSVWLALIVGLLAGLIVGTVNGLLISRYNVNPLIQTLGMSILLGGVATWYTKGQPISSDISEGMRKFGSLNWFGLPRLLVVLIPVIAATWYLIEHTPFGRHLAAIGSNPRAARLVGINVQRSVLRSMAVGGLLSGIAGVLLLARSSRADIGSGPSYLFPALAATFLGMTAIKPGKANVLGAVIGAYFVGAAVSGLTLAGAQGWASGVFNGLALLVSLGFTAWAQRRAARKAATAQH